MLRERASALGDLGLKDDEPAWFQGSNSVGGVARHPQEIPRAQMVPRGPDLEFNGPFEEQYGRFSRHGMRGYFHTGVQGGQDRLGLPREVQDGQDRPFAGSYREQSVQGGYGELNHGIP